MQRLSKWLVRSAALRNANRRHYLFFGVITASLVLWLILYSEVSRSKLHVLSHYDAIHHRLKNIPNISLSSDLKDFMLKPLVNPHPFSYVHNPTDKCRERRVDVIFVVPSAPENSWKRQKLRTSNLYDYISDSNNHASLVFFLGHPTTTTKTKTIQSIIDNESNHYNDVVQENYTDVYKNIRLKAVSMLKWVSTFCSDVKYVIRVDDDTVVNVNDLIDVIDEKGHAYDNFVLGNIRTGESVIRHPYNKYFVSQEEYNQDKWPPFAPGGLTGYPLLTVTLLYEASLRLRPVWLDDVYITGICGKAVNVTHLSDLRFQFKHCMCPC